MDVLDLFVEQSEEGNRLRHEFIDVAKAVLNPRSILLIVFDVPKRYFRSP